MDILDSLAIIWKHLAAAFTLFISLVASGHAILYKRDPRAAVLWLVCIWLLPVLGAVLYLLIGINRIRRIAASLRADLERYSMEPKAPPYSPQDVERHLPAQVQHLWAIAEMINKITLRPLLPGNRIEPLVDGDEAFPAMLQAIDQAAHSVTLATYIFDNDPIGCRFADALGRAVQRGVAVRVLVDDTGARYSWPSIVRRLRKLKVPVARFLPIFSAGHPLTMNLRNHRKILVTDGKIGFTGGMNIRQHHLLSQAPHTTIQDLHFRLTGPVVAQLQEIFAEDWFFSRNEALQGPLWFPELERTGEAIARGIPDGPDEDFEKLRWSLLGAIGCARFSIQVVTPYFLPDRAIISALNVAAMRGVQVDIILPRKSNLPFVQWATFAMLWQILRTDCRVWLTPPPFDHSKLMVVDRCWTLFGSANWDARSLRLNFELDVECFDVALAEKMEELIARKLSHARLLTLEEIDSRSLPVRLRDGMARLLTPYL